MFAILTGTNVEFFSQEKLFKNIQQASFFFNNNLFYFILKHLKNMNLPSFSQNIKILSSVFIDELCICFCFFNAQITIQQKTSQAVTETLCNSSKTAKM